MSTTDAAQASSGSKVIRSFFDAIASRYDFLNTFLSFRLDESWRRRSCELLMNHTQSSILDLGTGTGKFLKLFQDAKIWNRCVGLDFSSQMLQTARGELSPRAGLVNGDFQALPFKNESFDLIVSAFALRSVQDMNSFLKGVYGLLSEKGQTGLLCLTRPRNFFWNILYYPYLKFYLPLVGGLISGNRSAYEFLSSSIMTFQEPAKTAEMMRKIGYRCVELHYFHFGMATLIMGRK